MQHGAGDLLRSREALQRVQILDEAAHFRAGARSVAKFIGVSVRAFISNS